ncbi:MAG: PAS domain-containing sensor histidine kinase [Bacteroidetes bacterium]|nr:PAS domain-containing sensor histidine kinase [Bacteroidota bacterium]
MSQIQDIINQYPWYYYTIGGLSLLLIIIFIPFMRLQGKQRKYKRQQLADQIDLQEAGKLEMWFKVFTAAAPQVFWIRNKIKTLYVSPFFETLIGYPEKLAKNEFPCMDQITVNEDLDRIKQNYSDFLNTEQKELDHTYRIRKPDNSIIWLRERVIKHQFYSGEWFLVGLLEDETLKQESLENLKNNQLLVTNILSSTDEGIYVLDHQFKPIYWNRAMETISGFSREITMDGQAIWEHFPHIKDNGVSDIMLQTMEGKITPGADYPYRLSNNRKGICHEKYLPLINSQDEITGVIGFIKDITEEVARENILEKTQEQYALTMQSLSDGIWDWNLSSNEIIFNDHCFSMLGYEPGELSSSISTFLRLINSETDRRLIAKIRESFLSKESVEIELKMKHKDGSWLWILFRGKCIEHDDQNKPSRAIGTQTNITERKKHEFELIKAKTKAEENDRLKSSFLSNMSHEIRTPLNAIIGFSDLIISEEAGSDDSKDKEAYRKQIRRNSDKLLNLISGIVELSQLEAGENELAIQTIDLVDFLKKTAHYTLTGIANNQKENLDLKIKIPLVNRGIQIDTDPQILRQVLSHILSNAYKFSEKGDIDLGCLPVKNGNITLFVKDPGIGIAEVDFQRIFNRFEQIDHGLTRNYEGTGLGLTLAKLSAELLGGNIWLESEPEQGSTFYIQLKARE